ncbi:MAG TPA: phosphoribosylaminoimidazolesuccinocarboxamide synthase [Candidatus Limnocylindrales bacterium]|nr:phosphoribosylaminoimidazolesuccinocarboxamide synthase [Candidatus Limnocylindrales bacterium]
MLAESFLRSGKVRDLHMLHDGRLLLVASDRISAFDVVLPSVIPDKGRVLTGLSRFWFAETSSIIPNHLLATDPTVLGSAIGKELASREFEQPDFGPLDAIRGRIMICRPANVVPVEAVVRGYLAGSGWKEYRERGTVCGIPLPPGLRESDRLPEPIFTPATKAEQGEHDENVSFDGMIDHMTAWWPGTPAIGVLAEAIRDRAIRLYRYGAAVAARRGIILADTKFEFGMIGESMSGPLDDHLTLIDEVMTPDSSRFWDAATYEPGRSQASFDKQFVRDWLEVQPWDKTDPGPELPPDVVAGTRARYVEAYERITGASFRRYLEEDVIAP